MRIHDRSAGEGGRMRGVLGAAGFGLILCLTSCLGIEASITLNENGSGKVVYQYRVSKMFASLKKDGGGPAKSGVPLPVTRQDLERIVARARGVTSAGVEQTETDHDVVLKGELRFDNVAALNRSRLFDEVPISLSREGGRTSFTLLLCDAREPLNESALDVYQHLFAGYELSFKITAPGEIAPPAPGGGTVSDDKRTLAFTIGLIDYLRLSDRTELRVSW